MKRLDEIKKIKTLKVANETYDGGSGLITIRGWRASVVWSYGGGWEHVSISPLDERITPTWDDMCELKDMFWRKDETVVQYHPAEKDYVNIKKNCLHLWKPIVEDMPKPPKIYV